VENADVSEGDSTEVPFDAKFKGRRFFLVRKEDLSGVSGTGVVAEGVEFQHGMVVVSFYKFASAIVYPNMRNAIDVHGHDGRTEIIYKDD
jgi:hypothetical protein